MKNADEILDLSNNYEKISLANLFKISRIVKLPNKKYRVLSEKGRNLGTYPSKSKAKERLKQVEFFKHKDQFSADTNKNIIDLTDADEFAYSAIVRKLREKCSKEQVRCFLDLFKKYFDNAVKNKLQNPEKIALQKALIKFNKINPIKIDNKLIKIASIHNFKKVADGIFRGSAPTPEDVLKLKQDFGINKIISLDKKSGEKISRTCNLLNIKQEKFYLNGSNKSLFNLLQHNLKKLLLDDGPTYTHCLHGKDRTGLIIALFKCKYMGMDPEDAIKEAKSFGFGIGVDPKIINLYEKLIRSCKSSKDINNNDIVSNEREYISDNRSSFLEEGHQGSFAPYLSETQQYPYDYVYNTINDQSPTRENYQSTWKDKKTELSEKELDNIPLIGIYNNNAGIHGAGPAEPVGGFIYD